MSSLFSKLRSLVSARVRGPRRYETKPAPPTETARERPPEPEVTEALARQHKLPEVTDAPQVESATSPRHERPAESLEVSAQPAPTASSRPVLVVKEPRAEQSQTEALEEERVADLLKGKQS
jgi:hypothetical protein